MSVVILFFIGAAVGSFLNVVIWRYQPDDYVFRLKNISGRSHCPYCGKKLVWFELIPIFSFLIQGGRCRSCRHPLSWQYPVVEILSGLLFVFLISHLNPFGFISLLNFIWLLVFLIWLLVAFIDLRFMLIPNELNLILAGLGIFLILIGIISPISPISPMSPISPISPISLMSPISPIGSQSFLKEYIFLFSPFPNNILFNHLLGAVVGVVVFGLIYGLGRGKTMGLGDVKLATASGLLLGWPDMGLAIILSFILGGIWGAVLLFLGKKTWRDKIPFAPIFIMGCFFTVFFGASILRIYFQLFSFY